MIQTIVSTLVEALLKKQKIDKPTWHEYEGTIKQILGIGTAELLSQDTEELTKRYENDPQQYEKIELIAVNMLQLAEEEVDNPLLKSKLRQDGIKLLKQVQENDKAFSLQRAYLLKLLEFNQ